MAEADTVRHPATSDGFYYYVSLWMCAIVAMGFVPGFFLPRSDPTVLQNLVVHLHAIVYVGWLALVAYQMRLPSQGRLATHRKLGQWLAGYAVLIIVMGLWVTFSRFSERIEMGDVVGARINMWPPFSDMLLFPVLFGLALAYRRQANVHKRLMVVACCSLTIPGAARMFFIGDPPNLLAMEVIFLSPVYLGVLRDWVVERRVYPIYLIGLAVLALIPLRMVVVEWTMWRTFTDWVASIV